jgi:hypothetical protein
MITQWQFLLVLALQLIIPHNLAFTVIESSARRSSHWIDQVRFQERRGGDRVKTNDLNKFKGMVANLSSTPKKNDNFERGVPSDDGPDVDELAQELLLKRMGMDPNNASPWSSFDAGQLPLPLFTSLVIFVGSTALTLYGIYVGLMGFPNSGP